MKFFFFYRIQVVTANFIFQIEKNLPISNRNNFPYDLKFIECELIRRRGKKIHVIDVRSHNRKTDPAWLQTLHQIKYDYDDDVMTVLVSYMLEEQQGHENHKYSIPLNFMHTGITNG